MPNEEMISRLFAPGEMKVVARALFVLDRLAGGIDPSWASERQLEVVRKSGDAISSGYSPEDAETAVRTLGEAHNEWSSYRGWATSWEQLVVARRACDAYLKWLGGDSDA